MLLCNTELLPDVTIATLPDSDITALVVTATELPVRGKLISRVLVLALLVCVVKSLALYVEPWSVLACLLAGLLMFMTVTIPSV